MKKLIAFAAICLSLSACSETGSETEATSATQPEMAGPAQQPDKSTQRQDTVRGTEDFLAFESIGGLKLNMPFTQTGGSLGKWIEGPVALWGADGLYHQSRYLRSKDLEVNVVSKDSMISDPLIFSVDLGERGIMRTDRNIGIGSTYEEVMAAYGNVINKEESNDSTLVAGSVYGGMIFTMTDGKVNHIFLGAAAE